MVEIIDRIVEEEGAYPIPVVRCHCGREVACYSDVNECECGDMWVNGWGQELKRPDLWEEDW